MFYVNDKDKLVSRAYEENKGYDKGNMPLIDIVLEVVDARIPISSRNPDIATFSKIKRE